MNTHASPPLHAPDDAGGPTVAQALREAAMAGLDRLDAQLLLLWVLGRMHDRAWLISHDRDILPAAARAAYAGLCLRRAQGEPLAYLVGRKDFYGLDLQVDGRVLIPRPDTEILVEWALDAVRPFTAPRLIDLGTGSGAIALALRQQRPDAEVHALDASADALAVARANAGRLGLPVTFWQGHWLAGHTGRGYDLVVSNPPYIAEDDSHLPALAFEPRQALTAGTDGLDDIRQIVEQARAVLRPGGWLLLEHGYDQAAAVRALLADAGYADIESRRDLASIERCSGGLFPGAR
ncbi:[protein release factor]-glutamine N5-methyltransferase [Comamonas sp. BIGb0124]|uniref:peptide chain release factor N(5)-glutamine methyltransferase n=1 Tax=Comamonas sp. BIGb0124 TaxID=2485130 RepID=UPI000FA30ACB|nr:peptide chain release factor N(5)-glutamine methyltransferase [Comamonas sp. BIGb0124]ROR20395.1 [protein release factor]-glutamine N5-methyltransferase [Comamonas sp. BIGb0124]